jgi:hypothetical protein
MTRKMFLLMIFFQLEKRFRGSRCRLLRHKELAMKTIQPGKSNRLIQSQQAASAAIRENPRKWIRVQEYWGQ